MYNINNSIADFDSDIAKLIAKEQERQQKSIELIASENFVSKAVMEAAGSVMTNKYAEGYPGKRYYDGCEYVDGVESLAIERAKKLFGCSYANVQPHSGSQANQAIYLALLNPGDTILGMSLDSGGHLTHGAAPNLSGKWFNAVHYNVRPDTYLIDYDDVRNLALKHKPKLIIAGYSAYSRQLDFAKFREIADEVGAFLMADVAHISGLVATGNHPSPFPHAHVATSTTHKTLRGPRGGIILSDDEEMGKKLNKAIFPGLQGGPLMHIIAAKAVAFKEALSDEFKIYINQVIVNSRQLADTLINRGYNVLTGGTDVHMMLVDLRKDSLTGKRAAESLDRAGITCNKNSVPFDDTSPFITSAIRIGTPACTTRGFAEKEFNITGNLIADLLDDMKKQSDNSKIEKEILSKVHELTKNFPLIY